MVLYVCENCNKEYTDKTDYIRHCNRKIKCKKLLRITPNVTPIVEYKCTDCNKLFTRKYNLDRHTDGRCKKAKENKKIEVLEKKIDKLTDIIKELKEDNINTEIVSNNISKNNTTNSHNMINSNNVNNTADTIVNNTVDTIVNNNIQLVKFGEEDLKKIAFEAIKYMNGYEGFYNLIKDTHFNEEVPENHNIYVSNSKFKNACVYDGERWLLRNLDEVRGELIEKKYDFLCDRFDTLKGESKISSSMEKKFMRFCKNYSELTGKQEKDFKNSIDLILYNNRDLPKKGRKKFEKLNKYIESKVE